jgi:hypothetical protein
MKKIFSILILVIFSTLASEAQEIKATVNANMDILDIDARNQASDFAYQLENYINSTEFSDLDWEGNPIPVNIGITFRSGGNGSYSAQMYVEARRPLGKGNTETVFYRGIENDWSFNYNRGGIPTYNTMRFDNLATVVDYYMLLIIGLYVDSYTELGGDQVYGQLRQLVSMGGSKQAPGFQMINKPGEFTKYNVASELTDPRFNDFRLYMYDYYVSGLDLMAEDKKIAMLNLVDIIYDMADFKQEKLSNNSVLLQLFFDSKAQEMAPMFADYENGEMLDVLRQLDPSNGQLYNSAKK